MYLIYLKLHGFLILYQKIKGYVRYHGETLKIGISVHNGRIKDDIDLMDKHFDVNNLPPYLENIYKTTVAIFKDALQIDENKIERLLLLWLDPKKEVKEHKDSGSEFKRSYRYHLVISTNSRTYFYFRKKLKDHKTKYHFKEGCLFEMGNTRFYHSIKNKHHTDVRLHILLDVKL